MNKDWIEKKAESIEELLRRDITHEDEETGEEKGYIITLDYTDKAGKRTRRRGEPYKIKGDGVYIHDLDKDSIRYFKFGRIRNFRITDEEFEPRYPLEL